MKQNRLLILIFFGFLPAVRSQTTPHYDKTAPGFLVFHPIRTDSEGKILPWYCDDPGKSYNHIIETVWNFWDTMRSDINGLPYYMNHQVWVPKPNDPRGLGGDQFSMAISSWQLLYQYTGNEEVRENMKFIAEYYLSHALSPKTAVWPNIPFPYNTLIYSGYYDGDMVEGKDITQPDKAGSFGWELVKLYKLTQKKDYHTTTTQRYLDVAIEIANTLAGHAIPGNEKISPLPFKVNAFSGETVAPYTTNWSGTLELFDALIQMQAGDTVAYRNASGVILNWMKKYPLKDNQWGPFFEDIAGFSDTQINGITFARYIMEHMSLFPNWKTDVKGIFNWVYQKLANKDWSHYGVTVINEQTVYRTPGNSHTSREASTELLYTVLSGDPSYRENAILQLNWATYCVDVDGKNNYPRDEVWLTDGYGDFVRHYLRSMAVMPELAPDNEDHILSSTSIVNQADYTPNFNKTLRPDVPVSDIDSVKIYYRTFDAASTEKIRMRKKPVKILLGKEILAESQTGLTEGWTWQPMKNGGLVTITHLKNKELTVY
jgi:hypothetical protein